VLGVKIYVICEEEKKTAQEELVQDMIAILTSFSGKLYGMRSKKRKKLLTIMKEVVSKENENGSK
jgi:predicted site-specific integrase-resolvase